MIVLSPDSAAAAPAPRIALLIPRWTDPGTVEPQGVPFRSFSICGAFLAAGYEVVFFDQEHDLDRCDRSAQLASELHRCAAAFIWMNEMYPSNQCVNTQRLASMLRRARHDLPIVAGGEFITVCPPGFLDIDSDVDYFLRGYGEAPGLALVEALRSGRDPSAIAGLCWHAADGTFRHNPPASRQDFRPEYLLPYRRLDLSCYVQTGGVFGNDQRTLTLSTGRGCTKGCRFCAWSTHPSRILGARDAFELLVLLRDRFDVRQFHFGELDFFMSRTRALELATLLRDHAEDIRWFALGSPIDLIQFSDRDWDLLRDGGLRKVEMGSEAASPALLRHIGKRHEPEDILVISAKLLARGIVPMNNFLFGFPGETAADRRMTLRMIDRLVALSPTGNHLTYRYYQPVWGTGLGELALAAEPDRPQRLDTWLAERHRYIAEDARTLPWLSEADEREVKELVNFVLPLATSRHRFASATRRLVYALLRARARAHVRRGRRGRGWTRWLYERMVGARLDQTFVA